MQRSNLLGLLAGTALVVLLAGCGAAEHTAAEPEPSTPESAVQTVEKNRCRRSTASPAGKQGSLLCL